MSGHRARFAVEAAAASVVGGLLPVLPHVMVHGAGAGVGRVWAALDPRHVRIAEEALATSFPDFIGCMQNLGADIREV